MSSRALEPERGHVPRALSSRAIARARRLATLQRFVRAFVRQPAGVTGVVILLVFVSVALLAPLLFPRDMLDITKTLGNEALAPPDREFWLGTDENGRSVLAVLVWGARTSLTVGFAASLISMLMGTLIGIGSGHYRGLLGSLLQRFTDWFLVIPFLPLVVVLAAVLGQRGLGTIILVLGVTSWPGTARLVRAQTLSVEGRPYLERAKVLGDSDWQQMTKHVLPNVMPLVIANTDADGRDRHPVGDHVVLPRPWRPVPRLLGKHAGRGDKRGCGVDGCVVVSVATRHLRDRHRPGVHADRADARGRPQPETRK